MSAIVKPKYLSVFEFLEWENQQETRHELIDGEIVAMTGGTVAHAALILQMGAALLNHLKGSPCRVFTSDLKVRAAGNIFYPDVVVSCDQQNNNDVLCHNPRLIIEILSNSTSGRDRHKKRLAYQQIESLEEYVLIAQEVKCIEIYRRADNWQVSIHTHGMVEFRSVELMLSVDDLYEGIY